MHMRRGQRRLNEEEERGGGGEGSSSGGGGSGGGGGRPINTRSCSTVVIRRLPTLSSHFLLLSSSSLPLYLSFFPRRFFFQMYCSLTLSLPLLISMLVFLFTTSLTFAPSLDALWLLCGLASSC